MSDNLHNFNDEVLEQDQIITDLTALTTRVGTNETNITTINNLNIVAKFAGTASTGLKTDITGNATDITNIETKTDFISVTQNVDLDTMETNIASNNAKNSYPSGDATKVGHISVSSAVNLNTMNTNITTNTNAIDAVEADVATLQSNKLDNNADDTMAGDLTIYKASDDNHINILCDATNKARLNICGNGSIQGSGVLYIGQGQTSSTIGTYGGYICYLGDNTPAADIGSSASSYNLGFSDYIMFGSVNGGFNRPVFYYSNANSGTNYADMYYLGDQYVFNSASYYTTGGAYYLRNSSGTVRGNVNTSNTVLGTYSGATGWTPTGTGTGSKVMLENTNGEGAGICCSSDAVCIWHADSGVYFVDEDAINSSSYAGFYALLTTSGTLTTSDERLKTDIKDLSFNRNILDIVNDIPVKTYYDKCMYDLSGNEERYEKNKHKYETLRLGTLAQSMPQEVKDLLVKDDDGEFPNKHYSVNYDRLIMFAIEAIKELKKEIDILKG